jgi:hypothetical protein
MWKHDPGPCPVDDAPHTTCVSPDYALQQVMLPARDGAAAPRSVKVIGDPEGARAPGTFTTGTYRRHLHGPRRG